MERCSDEGQIESGAVLEHSRNDRKRIKQLEKELHRKEKALAEAAALLILRKKAQAIWAAPEED